jgi:hypothetical protein
MMASASIWHERAIAEIEKLQLECPSSGIVATREFITKNRSAIFGAGYPYQVWKYEFDRLVKGVLPATSGGPDLKGEWPMTEAQRAFFRGR